MELASFKNGLRLHLDAIHLYKNKSYPSAFFISILSQEEIGKAYWLGEFIYQSIASGRMEAEWEEKYINQIYNHKFKQGFLKSNSWDLSHSAPALKALQKIYDGDLETLKHNAVYVGLKKNRGKIDLNSKIINPLKTNRTMAEAQITTINDFLLVDIKGIKKGYYSYDNEMVIKLLNGHLTKKLNKLWKVRSKKARNILKKFDSEE